MYTELGSERQMAPHKESHSQVRGGKSGNTSALSTLSKQLSNQHRVKKTPILEPVGLKNQGQMSGSGHVREVKEKKQQSFASLLQTGEKEKFGDRTPAGFRKTGLLGRGGIALVWLGEMRDPSLFDLAPG